MEHVFYFEKKCPVCKTVFIPTQEWVYKRGTKGVIKTFCSWGCMRAWDAKQEQKKKVKLGVCPYCDYSIDHNDKFCPNCGRKVI